MTDALLNQVRSLGFAVSVHRVNGVIEMHAVKLANPDEQHISRVIDGDGPDESYRCACELAQIIWLFRQRGVAAFRQQPLLRGRRG